MANHQSYSWVKKNKKCQLHLYFTKKQMYTRNPIDKNEI